MSNRKKPLSEREREAVKALFKPKPKAQELEDTGLAKREAIKGEAHREEVPTLILDFDDPLVQDLFF